MACCPGEMVKVSELICVKLLPTGSGGGGGGGGGGIVTEEEEEAEEHPLVMVMTHKHKPTADMTNALRIVQSSGRKHTREN